MAVQKHKVTRATRGKRRSHDALTAAALSEDSTTGEMHYRHHVTPDGYFRGRKVVLTKADRASGQEGEE